MSGKDEVNKKIVTKLYDAQSSGDFEEYFSLLSDKIIYHAAGNCIVSGVHKGKDKLKEIGMRTFKETNGSHRVYPKTMIANDTYVAVLDTWKATRRGHDIEMDNILVYKIEGEKVTEIREFIGNERRHDRFWS